MCLCHGIHYHYYIIIITIFYYLYISVYISSYLLISNYILFWIYLNNSWKILAKHASDLLPPIQARQNRRSFQSVADEVGEVEGLKLTYWFLAGKGWEWMGMDGNGWEWGNGIVINSYYGSFPHTLLSTSKLKHRWALWLVLETDWTWLNHLWFMFRYEGILPYCFSSSVKAKRLIYGHPTSRAFQPYFDEARSWHVEEAFQCDTTLEKTAENWQWFMRIVYSYDAHKINSWYIMINDLMYVCVYVMFAWLMLSSIQQPQQLGLSIFNLIRQWDDPCTARAHFSLMFDAKEQINTNNRHW